MTDITKLAQLRKELSNPAIGSKDHLRKIALSLVEALEKAQRVNAAQDDHINQMAKRIRRLEIKNTGIGQHINSLNRQIAGKTEIEQQQAVRIAELEREQEHLRVVGVMSEKAFHRLENRESRFIALWPRPEIYLPRKRPEDGVIVYARTAAAAGIKREAE
ncbi:ead/Ea22-like family protein [Klebsiella grimontii]|uniref:ead/Ea22-like family protein n=1 Tax=Klebsiella grimontii TaxID=2058152 RepID=UPI0012B76B4C|nr:ead/Ea22-like family protein [Klebsiella grimontii]MEB7545699.1 ead/Ea22-like family protein [Klebsiella grimontii]DAH06150.1 MAG TPA: Ead/Ea22-like protein [Bacteriophage sp.]